MVRITLIYEPWSSAIWKGFYQPQLGDLQSPWFLTTYPNWGDPPSGVIPWIFNPTQFHPSAESNPTALHSVEASFCKRQKSTTVNTRDTSRGPKNQVQVGITHTTPPVNDLYFWRSTPSKQGLFQSEEGSFRFQAYIFPSRSVMFWRLVKP